MKNQLLVLSFLMSTLLSCQNTPSLQWQSPLLEKNITCVVSEPQTPLLDFEGKAMTVVYLENLGFESISSGSNEKNVHWLLQQGYRVVEMNYEKHAQAQSPFINQEIIAINDSIASGSFLNLNDCSLYRSYVLCEGYRIKRDVSYYKDDPSIYNTPDEYQQGDSLYLDIIYPENPKQTVPIVLSFSYSNSFLQWDADKQELSNSNKHQRLKQAYTLAGFNDSFLEGAPARGLAWAIADHPKYCSWGKGKQQGGSNDTYKSFQTNPDAVRKVKSAIRTLRVEGENLGLSGDIGIYGFSRGATAGALAIGGKFVDEFENEGLYQDVNDEVQAAVLGPGVFNYTLIYDESEDGDKNLEQRCPKVWGDLKTNREQWEMMGADFLVEDSLTAPVLFFYNTTDEAYYQSQIAHLKQKIDSLQVPNQSLVDYGEGHSVPQSPKALQQMYDFLVKHL